MALMLCINFFVLLLIGPILGGSMNTIILFMVISSTMVLALDYFRSVVLALAGEYDRANEEKIRAERFKTELITNVSHDIRTPLTALISYVDLLKGLPVEHEGFTEYVGVLEKKSARLKTLIDDLMEASKATTGNVGVNLERVDLAEIVGQIAGEFEEQFAERDLALVFPQPSQPVFVQADSRHLWRALENLFANVVKYALPKTRVFADIALRDDGAWFTLKNTSQSPIELSGDALTEQFIRGDRARQTEGSGLGLYIAKSLMELMGGDLTIHTVGDLFEAELRFG
jgi:signal transduction histidine kinase